MATNTAEPDKPLNLSILPTPITTTSNPGVGNYQYNGVDYYVLMALDNSGKFKQTFDEKSCIIHPNSVISMTIKETFFNWAAEGTAVIGYNPNDTADEKNAIGSYQFRSDGFDLLRIVLIPMIQFPESIGDMQDPKWQLSHLFSIYNVEDVSDSTVKEGSPSTYFKYLKLSFRDVRLQLFQTINTEYSTSYYDPVTRKCPTGIALKQLIEKAFSYYSADGLEVFGTIFSPLSSQWENGASQIFYTSPVESSVSDDLDYVYAHHVSSNNLAGVSSPTAYDFSILGTTRASTPGIIPLFTLSPLKSYFDKALKGSAGEPGELQYEHFFTTSLTTEENTISNIARAPRNDDVHSAKYGQIISFSFTDIIPEINSKEFVTSPVYYVDPATRTIGFDFKGNDVETARKAISENYIKGLYKDETVSSIEDLFIPTLHKSKKTTNVFPIFSLHGDDKIARTKKGLLNLIYAGLFQNTCICFRTLGLTLRTAGYFIGIDEPAGSTYDNDFTNKLYGQYFVIGVEHVFESGAYVNKIYAVKLHRFKQQKTKFENTI